MSNFQCNCSSKLYRKHKLQMLKSNVNFLVPSAGYGRKSAGYVVPTRTLVAPPMHETYSITNLHVD